VQENKELAAAETKEARAALEVLDNILGHTLDINDTVRWESLKNSSDFPKPKPEKPALPPKPERPQIPPQPSPSDFAPRSGILDRIFAGRRAAKKRLANKVFKEAREKWKEDGAKTAASYNTRVREYNDAAHDLARIHRELVAAWEEEGSEYLRKRDQANAAIDQKRDKYLKGDPEAIEDYCDMVLSNSEYPDYFPQSYELEFNPDNKTLIVDYELPGVGSLPTVTEVRYVQSRDDFEERQLPNAEVNRQYDKVLYQVALRTIHELYEADAVGALESVVFNGYVHSVDKATGQETHPCVLSLQAGKAEFAGLNLRGVEPKACFRKLKGVSSSALHSMTPVAPVLRMDRQDKRFIDGRPVVDSVAEGDNLALMDWADFEHLIRELFEKEFAPAGGQVKVTRASRDGGVDAVIFDPDPLRGGKIVVQAKRYTNTVGLSAVRDLYGTVINEGANKGILISTSDYGPDAYEFAKAKPLVLLSGGELLHLLEKHGHRARIDLVEAKRLLAEKEMS
jgi:restriction system protein